MFPGDGKAVGAEEKQVKEALAFSIILPMCCVKGFQMFQSNQRKDKFHCSGAISVPFDFHLWLLSLILGSASAHLFVKSCKCYFSDHICLWNHSQMIYRPENTKCLDEKPLGHNITLPKLLGIFHYFRIFTCNVWSWLNTFFLYQ